MRLKYAESYISVYTLLSSSCSNEQVISLVTAFKRDRRTHISMNLCSKIASFIQTDLITAMRLNFM